MQKEVGSVKIGILSLQGGVIEHLRHIRAIGEEAVEIKKPSDLENIDGIILPGGESTTMGKLLRKTGLMEDLREKIIKGMPVWGTCAGMILLAKKIEGEEEGHLKVMDIEVRRNAYGSQLNSFTTEMVIEEVSLEPMPLVFIRAPFITKVSDNMQVMLKVNENIVAVKQGNILATSFHPELTADLRFHRYFVSLCRK